jgi:hypothetical protein
VVVIVSGGLVGFSVGVSVGVTGHTVVVQGIVLVVV